MVTSPPKSRALLRRTLVWLTVLGCCALSLFAIRTSFQSQRLHDLRYRLRTLVQEPVEGLWLPTQYLAELMQLHRGPARPLYSMDPQHLQALLLNAPCMLHAVVQRLPPHALRVRYTTRIPQARCGDLHSALLDADGVVFPATPLQIKTELPVVYLGWPPVTPGSQPSWGWGSRPFPHKKVQLFQKILSHHAWEAIRLVQVDLSRIEHQDYGKREIVCIAEPMPGTKAWLRLPTLGWEAQLAGWREWVRRRPQSSGGVVDLRVLDMALIQPIPEDACLTSI